MTSVDAITPSSSQQGVIALNKIASGVNYHISNGVYVFNAIAEASLTTVLAASSTRTQIVFHNPGANDVFVAPTSVLNASTFAPSNAALGGCFRVYGNGGTTTITGGCQTAWQAFAVTGAGSSNPLTVMD